MNLFYATKNAIEALKPLQDLIQENGGDDDLLAGMIEGETNVMDILNRLLKMRIENEMQIAGIFEYLSQLKARAEKFERENETIKSALESVFSSTGLEKHKLPLGTLSYVKGRASIEISDRALREDGSYDLPDEFVAVKFSPKKKELMYHLNSGFTVDFVSKVEGGKSFRVSL